MAALTNDEALWVEGVSQGTGIDPRVLIAWAQGEGHPGDTGHNYLNITATTARSLGVQPSGVLAANTAAFPDVQTGIAATVKEMQNLGLTHEQGKTPAQAISDIAATGWASSHYGGAGGPNLVADFQSIFGSGSASSSYQGPGTANAVASTAGTGSAADITSLDLGNVVPKLSLPDWLKFLTSWRFVEIVGGFLLLIVGLYLVGRQFGLSVPGVPGAVASKAAGASETVTPSQDRAAEAHEHRIVLAGSREARAAELHTHRVKTEQARATAMRSRSRTQRLAVNQKAAASAARERSAYYRGAADAGAPL